MVRLPQALEAKRITLLALARRRAFESYLRHGRVPKVHQQAAAFALGAVKALGPEMGIPAAALPTSKATAYYTWRTAGDERVRAGHAAHAGQVFAWANPPAGGHPGAAPNCRCWAEPYYGTPNVPDALLKLSPDRQVDATGRELWASIDTLRRPDGSLVESAILGRDGTQFRSRFSGSSVARTVTLPGGDTNFGLSDDDSFETQAEAIEWAILCDEVPGPLDSDPVTRLDNSVRIAPSKTT